jgi:hypothetical protein
MPWRGLRGSGATILDDYRPLGLRTFLGRTHDDLLLAAHPAKVPRRFKIVALLIESISPPIECSISSLFHDGNSDSGPAPFDLAPFK